MLALGVALAPAAALAQSDEWETPSFSGQESPPPPPESHPELPPPPLESADDEPLPEPRTEPRFELPPEDPEEFYVAPPPPPLDSFTLYGGRALGRGRSAVALSAGYPYVGLRYARGLSPRFDLGMSVETFYGMMTDGSVDARWEALRWGALSVALNGSLGGAFFLRPARTDSTWGARWITGRRHLNGELGGSLSLVPGDGRGLHPFIDVRFLLAVDLEPTQVAPLGGLPPAFVMAGNTLIRVGAEVPLSARAGLFGSIGLDLHGRPEDSRVFFNVAIGAMVAF